MKYQTNEFRKGLKLEVDGQPNIIVENQFIKPGKGQPFNKVRLKNLVTGNVIERTYKSGESVEGADMEERTMQYLYTDGSVFHFMDNQNHDQVEIKKDQLGETWKWIQESMDCEVLFYKGNPLTVEIPNFAIIEITYCEPGVKGNTATGATKPATLETGAEINVPLFVEQGDKVKVDTRTGEYVERYKG
ncbi:MAG: elongation factor P [Nitrospinota bacterium]